MNQNNYNNNIFQSYSEGGIKGSDPTSSTYDRGIITNNSTLEDLYKNTGNYRGFEKTDIVQDSSMGRFIHTRGKLLNINF